MNSRANSGSSLAVGFSVAPAVFETFPILEHFGNAAEFIDGTRDSCYGCRVAREI